jgi:hypothetical protein
MKRKSVKNPLLLAMDTYSASFGPSWSEVAKRGLKEAILTATLRPKTGKQTLSIKYENISCFEIEAFSEEQRSQKSCSRYEACAESRRGNI